MARVMQCQLEPQRANRAFGNGLLNETRRTRDDRTYCTDYRSLYQDWPLSHLGATRPRLVDPRWAIKQMLRIEKESDGCVSRLKLSGRIQSACIPRIRSAMNDGCTRIILDLGEVTLVDIAAVRFLISCENEGVEFVQCPPYVREWMLRERAEGVQPENA